MDFSKLTFSSSRVQDDLVALDETFVTKKGCKIYIPCSYEDSNLLSMGEVVYTLGIFAYVVDDKYFSVSIAHAKVSLTPTTIDKIKINDELYYELYFEPGSTVIGNHMVEKDDTICSYIHELIISSGKVPEFMSYIHVVRLFEKSKHFSGLQVGANKAHSELLAACIARDPNDKMVYYREVINNLKDLELTTPAYVPFVNVMYNATNTSTRLGGGWFDDGLNASLVIETKRLEPIEEILRR